MPPRPAIHAVDPGGRRRRALLARVARRASQALPARGRGSHAARRHGGDRARAFADALWVVCGDEHAREIRKASGLPAHRVLVEPLRRNTAMAVAFAATRIAAEDPDAVMVVLPADHHIPDRRAFAADLRRAVRAAADAEVLVTLGVRPSRPDTGYGYIQRGRARGRSPPGAQARAPVRGEARREDGASLPALEGLSLERGDLRLEGERDPRGDRGARARAPPRPGTRTAPRRSPHHAREPAAGLPPGALAAGRYRRDGEERSGLDAAGALALERRRAPGSPWPASWGSGPGRSARDRGRADPSTTGGQPRVGPKVRVGPSRCWASRGWRWSIRATPCS